MKAKFITLEGIEGSGKTSSLKSITDLLDKKNISYVVTREPGGGSIGKELRSILLDPETEISPEVELMLMLSDRKDHVEKIILPNLEKGNWVVSDRFMDSSIAYQGGGRQLGKKLIISLSEYLIPARKPFVPISRITSSAGLDVCTINSLKELLGFEIIKPFSVNCCFI